MTKVLVCVLALASMVAGCSSGAQEAGPVPTVPTSTGQTTAPTTTEPTPSTSTNASTPIALCEDKKAAVKVDSEQGAAGTIRTVWRVKNTAQHPCRSAGYPGMDFHSSSGWLGVRVHRGGFPDINQAPAPVVVDPGHSLYFVSYWNDVTTNAEPCTEFDRVKVTQPDNFAPVKLASSGCLNPQSVDVGRSAVARRRSGRETSARAPPTTRKGPLRRAFSLLPGAGLEPTTVRLTASPN